MSPTQPPSSADETLGRILHELGSLRGDFGAFRETGDSRHRMLVNELAEVRTEARRAVEIAAEAKRLADSSSHEMRDMQRAVVEHTKGLAATQSAQAAQISTLAAETSEQTKSLKGLAATQVAQATQISALAAETGQQTKSLDALLVAETERKARETEQRTRDDERKQIEDEQKKITDARWTSVTRWWPIALVVVGAIASGATFLISHWRP